MIILISFWKSSLTFPENWSPKEGKQHGIHKPKFNVVVFEGFFFFVAKCDLKLYDMEDSKNKLPINFQVHIMLSSMMKTHTVLLLPIPCIINLSLHTVVYPRHTHCAPGWALVSVLVCSSAAVIKHWPKATFRGGLSGIELTVYLQRKPRQEPPCRS